MKTASNFEYRQFLVIESKFRDLEIRLYNRMEELKGMEGASETSAIDVVASEFGSESETLLKKKEAFWGALREKYGIQGISFRMDNDRTIHRFDEDDWVRREAAVKA